MNTASATTPRTGVHTCAYNITSVNTASTERLAAMIVVASSLARKTEESTQRDTGRDRHEREHEHRTRDPTDSDPRVDRDDERKRDDGEARVRDARHCLPGIVNTTASLSW